MKVCVILIFLFMALALAAELRDAPDPRIADAKDILNRLYTGDTSVMDRLDWTQLQLVNDNFRERDCYFKADSERVTYRENCLLEFYDKLFYTNTVEALTYWVVERDFDTGYQIRCEKGEHELVMDFVKAEPHSLLCKLSWEWFMAAKH